MLNNNCHDYVLPYGFGKKKERKMFGQNKMLKKLYIEMVVVISIVRNVME